MPQTKTTGLSAGSVAIFFSSSFIGMLTEPLIMPEATSFGSRTSTSITEPGLAAHTAWKESTVTEPFSLPGTSAAVGAAEAPAAAGAPAGAAAGPAASSAALVPGKEKGSVTVDSFQAVWKANPGSVMLVDVRDPKEVASGMIKGSVNIPMNELEKKIATLPADKPVVFVCGTGARSGEAYDTVKLLGGKVQAYFLDADVKFSADGTYTMAAKK